MKTEQDISYMAAKAQFRFRKVRFRRGAQESGTTEDVCGDPDVSAALIF